MDESRGEDEGRIVGGAANAIGANASGLCARKTPAVNSDVKPTQQDRQGRGCIKSNATERRKQNSNSVADAGIAHVGCMSQRHQNERNVLSCELLGLVDSLQLSTPLPFLMA